MKKYKNKILISIILIVFAISLIPNNVYAGMQANKGGTSLVSTTAGSFFDLIRTMEASVGTLGVGPDTESKKNGIDAHMAKNTEWGTAAMLAVSSYGTGNVSTASAITTGNESGIYNMGNEKYEYTANKMSANNSSASSIINAQAKYKNVYANFSERIPGDAMNLGAVSNLPSESDCTVLCRGATLFNYMGYAQNDPRSNRGHGGKAYNSVSSRACVVMGSGL